MDLSALGVGSAGIWTRAAALRALPPGQVRAKLRDGTWQTVHRGVYADGGTVLAPEQRAFAAVLAAGGENQSTLSWRAVACGRTAARVWRLPLIDDDDPATGAYEAHLDAVAVRRRRGRAGALTGHVLALAPHDVLRRPSGLLLTPVARTLFDCARLLSHDGLVCAIDDALHRGLVTTDQLAAMAARTAGRPGALAFRAAVALADGRSESPLETLTRLLLLPALPALEPQVEVFDRGMRLVARFDLADRQVRLAVEADGATSHAGSVMVAKDRRRDRRTESLGWQTERVTWWDVRVAGAATRSRICGRHAELGRKTA